jgi:hypothetical protein
MDLGQKSVCKAPESSVVKGLLYAGFKRDSVSWPEVEPQSTAQFRDRHFRHRGVRALRSVHYPGRIRTLEQGVINE